MKYLNLKTSVGVETVDELDPKEFKTMSEFNKELNKLRDEYRLSGMMVYISTRADKEWLNEKKFKKN